MAKEEISISKILKQRIQDKLKNDLKQESVPIFSLYDFQLLEIKITIHLELKDGSATASY